jgi:hypothetical protein
MDMSNYYAEMTEKALEGYRRINNTDQVENKKYEVPNATWDVNVVRSRGMTPIFMPSSPRCILPTPRYPFWFLS